MRRLFRISLIIGVLSVSLINFTAMNGYAQSQRDYTLANQLIQQERYEAALELLKPLLDRQPTSIPIYQRTMECLVQLKRYHEAMVLTNESIKRGLDSVQGNIQMAELQHLDGNVEEALETWNSVLEERPNLGTYLSVARSMKDRGMYEGALKVYESAQEKFKNGRLFLHEIAYTYLLAGEYEPAMRSFVQLIIQNPRRYGYVQRNLQRFSDEALFDAAILETEDALDRLNLAPEAFSQLVQLDLWLLMERELYDRAIASVNKWIRQDKASPYILIDLGRRLRSSMAFKASIEAFDRAADQSSDQIKATALYEQAVSYEQWAIQERHQNRLAMVDADSLYSNAEHSYIQLLETFPQFSNRNEVYGALSAIALEVNQDTTSARTWLNRMKRQLADPESNFDYNYLKGKMALFQRDFIETRIRLTRALKLQKSDQEREHMRYLLGLADFYQGDYEFAKTQLDALKRQSTSLFANDALQLKLWLNEGGFADSTGRSLNWLAQLHQQVQHRAFDDALVSLDSLRGSPAGRLLEDDAIYLLGQAVPEARLVTYYIELDTYLSSGMGSPLQERLLWERIQRADQLINLNRSDVAANTTSNTVTERSDLQGLPQSEQDVTRLLKELLDEYPQGFYADQAREKLRFLSESESTTTS